MADWLSLLAAPQEMFVWASLFGAAFLIKARRPKHPEPKRRGSSRPGWLTRRRALAGIAHKGGRVGIGYASPFKPLGLDVQSLNHHGMISGTTGAGKTTILRSLYEGYPGPVIGLDCKGSPDLADTVWSLPGHVWELGGALKLDLLDPEPAIMAQQLLEGETFTDRAAVYRAIAEHAIQRAGWVMKWQGAPRDPKLILELIASPTYLAAAIRKHMPKGDPMAERWLVELDSPSVAMREGFQTMGERLGTLLDSPAGRSLGTGPDALTLSDVLATRSKLLVRLAPRYGGLSRKVGAWVLVALLRLADELRTAHWQGNCLIVVDEPRVLGHEGRWLADVFGTVRDAGLGLVVADQGIAGLKAVHPDMPDAVMRNTAWQLVLRQGSYADAEAVAELFGKHWTVDSVSVAGDGKTNKTYRFGPRVEPSWLLELPVGQGWLRVAPTRVWAKERIDQVAVAMPRVVERFVRRLALPAPRASSGASGSPVGGELRTVPEDGGPSYATVRELVASLLCEPDAGGCVRAREPVVPDKDGYQRVWWQGRCVNSLHRRVYEWEHGSVPFRHEVHHVCGHRWCLAVKHLKALPKGAHMREEAERRRTVRASGEGSLRPPQASRG